MAEAKNQKIVITPEIFGDMLKIREELDGLLETIEIMNDKQLMKAIKKSQEDLKAGRVHRLKSVNDLDKLWK